jgi:hypothetical protein
MKIFILTLLLVSLRVQAEEKQAPVKVLAYLKLCRSGDADSCEKADTAKKINELVNACNERGIFGKQSTESKGSCNELRALKNRNPELYTAEADIDDKDNSMKLAIPDKKLRSPANSTNEEDNGDCDNCG